MVVREGWEVPEGTLVFPALVPPGGGETELALQHTTEGELVAVGFTSLDALIATFGPGQRWLAFAAEATPVALEGSGATRLLIDPRIDWAGAEAGVASGVPVAETPPVGWSSAMKLRRARDDDPAKITNPEVVVALLAAYDSGADSQDPARFEGARFVVPIGPGGLPVVVTSLRTIPLFTDREALEAWLAPCVGVPADADFEPVVSEVRVVAADGLAVLSRSVESGSFTVNPAGPGWSWYSDPAAEIPGVANRFPAGAGGGSNGADDGRFGTRDDRVDPKRRKGVRSEILGAFGGALELRHHGREAEALVRLGRGRRLAQGFGDAVSFVSGLEQAAQIDLARDKWLEASGLAIVGYNAAGTHAKPRLEYEGYRIMAAFDREAIDGDEAMKQTAKDTAASRATYLRALADVAVEQGSMSRERRDDLYQEAAHIAATWLD
jgi:hypothetical protein